MDGIAELTGRAKRRIHSVPPKIQLLVRAKAHGVKNKIVVNKNYSYRNLIKGMTE
jgi:hypothetical protein